MFDITMIEYNSKLLFAKLYRLIFMFMIPAIISFLSWQGYAPPPNQASLVLLTLGLAAASMRSAHPALPVTLNKCRH